VAERTLPVVFACVAVVALYGMVTAPQTSLNERRPEMAVLRSVGAWPLHVFGLILRESLVLILVGALAALALLHGLLAAA
jgi:putative ABC transport system permease protein